MYHPSPTLRNLHHYLILTTLIYHTSRAQVPTDAPACVQNCGRVKVSEGYCSASPIFAIAYANCLKDNCNTADAMTGAGFVNSFCGSSSNSSTSVPPTPTSTAPVPVPTTNTTTNTDNGTYASSVKNALDGAGLTTLANLLSSQPQLVNQLAEGNHTILAPTNDALSALNLNNTTNNASTTAITNTTIESLLKYHVLPGFLVPSVLPTGGHAIVRSSLSGEPFVNLPANDSQVIVFAGDQNPPLTIIEATRNISVTNTTQVSNLQLAIIPTALTIPGTIGTTVAGLPELSGLVTALNGASPQLIGELDQTPGLTIFAPINSALSAAGNVTNLQGVLLNHLVNGTVLYSTVLANVTNATSAGGSLISFANDGKESTVTSGSKTIKIVQSDIITKNGVIHLVDGIFDPSNSTPSFPLPNTQNNTETIGIVPIGNNTNSINSNNGNTQGNASQSSSNKNVEISLVSIIMTMSIIYYLSSSIFFLNI